jgi:transposase
MVVVDGHGLPLGLHVDSAQHHELKLAQMTLETIRVPRRGRRARTRPKRLLADRLYHSADFRAYLRRRGIAACIPPYDRGRQRKRPRRGRPIRAGEAYSRRWKVERCFAWMHNYRRLVVRYDRSLAMYRAFCLVAFILWCINRILK